MREYSLLPVQTRADIDECVIAFDAGGRVLAEKTFRAIAQARKLTTTETVMLGGHARDRLCSLGLLPIG